jgi:hypothetical protein
MGAFAMILLDDAIRWAERHGYNGKREGDRLVLYPQNDLGSVSLLLDLAREAEGIVRVGRLSLERMVLGDGGKPNVLH